MSLGQEIRNIFNAAVFPVRHARVALQKNTYNPYVDFLCASYNLPRQDLLTYTRKDLEQGFAVLNKSRSFTSISFSGQMLFWAAYAALNAAALPVYATVGLAVGLAMGGLLAMSARNDHARGARRLHWMNEDRDRAARLKALQTELAAKGRLPS